MCLAQIVYQFYLYPYVQHFESWDKNLRTDIIFVVPLCSNIGYVRPLRISIFLFELMFLLP